LPLLLRRQSDWLLSSAGALLLLLARLWRCQLGGRFIVGGTGRLLELIVICRLGLVRWVGRGGVGTLKLRIEIIK